MPQGETYLTSLCCRVVNTSVHVNMSRTKGTRLKAKRHHTPKKVRMKTKRRIAVITRRIQPNVCVSPFLLCSLEFSQPPLPAVWSPGLDKQTLNPSEKKGGNKTCFSLFRPETTGIRIVFHSDLLLVCRLVVSFCRAPLEVVVIYSLEATCAVQNPFTY